MNKIITISRQYQAGGREIGKILAQKYNIPFYDSKIIGLAAKESGVADSFFEEPERNASNSLLYSIVRGMQYQHSYSTTPWSLEETIYRAQSDIIKKVANEGPCVIIGRCADYTLRDRDDVVKIFVHANIDLRIKKASAELGVDYDDAEDEVIKKDKRRANYYNYHSDTKWGAVDNYDISINTTDLGTEKAAEVISKFLENL